MDEHDGRSLTQSEVAALDFMLSADFPGVAELRQQARTARVVGRCSCGCPSIDIAVDRTVAPPAIAVLPGAVASATSRDPRVTHLTLWVDGDYLSGLELSWLDEYPDEFPSPETFDPPKRG